MVAYAASFGEHTIPIIAIAYWVIIGSGFRYGRGYLFLSTGAGMLGILYNMAFSPQWSEYLFIGLSYLLSILIVALYTTALLKRVTETNRKLTKSLNHVSTLARIDSLTGLPNRLALVERLTQSIAMTKRQRTCVALLYFDLDGFKAVNDTFGHNRGDALLIEVAKRVVPVMRATDTLARLGGDEFVIILESIRFPEDATLVANKVLGTVKEIAVVAADSVLGSLTALRISVSIGISAYVPSITPDAPSADILIKRADEAMYLAKQAGKGCYRVWTDNSALQHSIDTV